MKTISLLHGVVAKVSDEDYDYLKEFKWHLNSWGSAQSLINGEKRMMHRMVAERAGIDCSNDINHVSRDRLDNRRENLRAATRSQSLAYGLPRGPGLKGTRMRGNGRWKSEISVNSKTIHLGTFDTEVQAHEAYFAAAQRHFEEFANSGRKS